jgi:hypothetical protein
MKLKDKAEVYLHLKIDNFEPDIMYPEKNNHSEYFKVRMVPAKNLEFFYSSEGVPRFRTDLPEVNADTSKIPELKRADEKGMSIPWNLNVLLCGPQNRIKIDLELLEQLNCLPRPKRKRVKKEKIHKVKPKWSVDKSIFRRYKMEGPPLLEK